MIEDMTEIVEMETADNTLLYVNDAYCRYFGKKREELIGASSNDLIHPDSLQKVLDTINYTLTPEKPYALIDARVIKGTGETGWMSWTVRGFFNEAGVLLGNQSVGRDITELRNYQEQIKLSEARYRGIVEDQTELIVRVKPDNTLLFANEAYCRFCHQNLADLIGKPAIYDASNQYHKDDYHILSPDYPAMVYSEKLISPDNQITWIEWTARGFFNNCSELIEIQKVGRNITDRKNAEEALQKTKAELEVRVQERTVELTRANRELTILNNNMQNIFLNIPLGVLVADESGKVNKLNNYLNQVWGDVAEEISDIIGNYIIGRRNPYLNRLFKENQTFQDVEFSFPTGKGDIHCLVSGIYTENRENQLKSGLILIRPIKEIHKLVNRFSGATARFQFTDIATADEKMRLIIKNAKLAAASMSNVLITGESGTGKEMFAQAIHNYSDRSAGPFVAVNCGAIPRELLGSELFGYTEGAFTGAKKGGNPGKFELATGGTIFLDEIGDMPIDQQVALLRVIQEKCVIRIGGNKVVPIDVRIICATHRDLLQQIGKGNFRQDLYYRLNVINIIIPPLRDRPQDIPILMKEFLIKSDTRWQYNFDHIDQQVISYLKSYNWPGNVRELQNVVERMLHFADGQPLSLEHLPADIFTRIPVPAASISSSPDKPWVTIRQLREKDKKLQEDQECLTILQLLNSYQGNISKVAREMGIARSTLYAKMEKCSIKS